MTFTNRTALLRAVMLGASALTMTAVIATPVIAQTTTSTVRGVVRDAAGAPVAGTVVSARNEGTNQIVTSTTSAGGELHADRTFGRALHHFHHHRRNRGRGARDR